MDLGSFCEAVRERKLNKICPCAIFCVNVLKQKLYYNLALVKIFTLILRNKSAISTLLILKILKCAIICFYVAIQFFVYN
jgi:hypothetical protein